MDERKSEAVQRGEVEAVAPRLPELQPAASIEGAAAHASATGVGNHPWLLEAQRRSEEIRSGRAETVAWEDVLAEMERDL